MPENLIRTMPWDRATDPALLLSREWLVTNGLGGFASASVAGALTRRYHGYLVAALPAPIGRTVMLSHLQETIRSPDGSAIELAACEGPDGLQAAGMDYLEEFRLELGLPVWEYQIGPWRFEKRVLMPHGQNTVQISYRLLQADGPLRLELRPAVQFRALEAAVDTQPVDYAAAESDELTCEIESAGYPPLRMKLAGAAGTFIADHQQRADILFRVEVERGYPAIGSLSSPGYFTVTMVAGETVTLIASTESAEAVLRHDPVAAATEEIARRRTLLQMAAIADKQDPTAELTLAADQFIITPGHRDIENGQDVARHHAATTVIAGYHWFTDWGRDTMISLEGLTLATGRHREARSILHTFMAYVRDGLVPNMFPEHDSSGLYHTADATLWFFHALNRYLRASGDRDTLRSFLPKLMDIVEHHLRGTRFNIGVDAADGLLRQGAEGYQLTWMDAKVDGWVVTPRRGKAVELNALWYNALCLLAGWVEEEHGAAAAQWLSDHAAQTRASFNRRFWHDAGEHLFDIVDGESGDDAACRPNQIFAIALDHPVLDRDRWRPVLATVETRLLTPVGLRSLAADHPDYKPAYFGDLRARDAAYHQGTVWGWLIGPFLDAYLKVNPANRAEAQGLLAAFTRHLDEAGLGTISEIFDAQAPYTARGCIAQAWSVAEVLRCRRALG